MCGRKSLKYEKQENEYTPDEQPEEVNNNDISNENNDSNENKISFDENNINNNEKEE